MKKIYLQPQIKAYVIKPNMLLAASGPMQVSLGSTNEQCAKSSNDDWEEE